MKLCWHFVICTFSLLVGLQASQQQDFYTKIIPNLDNEAVCLDGTPSMFYLNEGGDTSKFLIYFLEFGLCAGKDLATTLDYCYTRSLTILGSSTGWNDTMTSEGILSTSSYTNPLYYNWTKVIVIYCDGMLHQGYRSQPISYKGKDIYFRGDRIIKQHFLWLDIKYQMLTRATDIVFAGADSGAVGTFLWSNYLQEKINRPSVRFGMILDSGIILDQPTRLGDYEIRSRMQMATKLVNVEVGTPLEACNIAVGAGDLWKCLFLEYAHPFLKGRILLVNSFYDTWALSKVVQASCLKGNDLSACNSTVMKSISNYKAVAAYFLNGFAAYDSANRSVWAIACAGQGYIGSDFYYDNPLEVVPANSGNTVKRAITSWAAGMRVIEIDYGDWPSNSGCAKLSPSSTGPKVRPLNDHEYSI